MLDRRSAVSAALSFILVAILSLVGTTHGAAQPGAGPEESRVRMELVWRDSQVRPGSTAVLAAVLELQPTWHINPGLETGQASEFQIPTQLTLDLPDGWSVGDTQWPDAHELDLPALGGIVPVYEGRIIAYAPVTVPDDAAPGEHSIEARLRYQACDDSVCEMPTETSATATLTVVAADAEPVDTPDETARSLFDDYVDLDASDIAVGSAETEHLSVRAMWQMPDAAANDVVGLALRVKFKEDWHIYPGAGTPDEVYGFIPSTVELKLPPGWKSGAIDWPDAETIIFGTGPAQQEVAVYHDEVVIRVPLALPDASQLEAGSQPIIVTFGYQACNDEICDPPVEVKLRTSIDVVAPDAPREQPSVEAMDVFDGFAPDFTGVELSAPAVSIEEESHADGRFTLESMRWWGALLFVVIGMLWMIGRTFAVTSKTGWRLSIGAIGVTVMLGWLAFTLSMTAPPDVAWRPYSHDALQAALDRGEVAVLDFTADWCLNCKVVERTVLNRPDVAEQLNSAGVAPFIADVTTGTGEAQEKLNELGRGGIPLLAVIHPDSSDPILLRGLYTRESVLAAIRGEAERLEAGGHVFDFLGKRFTIGANAWPLVLLIAAVAGFLLNVTPCVLPVIPIKILSLQAHAADPKRCFALGFVFGLGIIAVFAVLGVLAVAIQHLITGATGFDWGALWQFWWFAGAMGLIVIIMGFGMLGLFDVKLPDFVYMFSPSSESTTGSFAMGAFTAVLSTPCTGPLLGATVAWVMAQPTWLGLTTFVVMGIGMAFPYVLLTAKPSWLERVPRSGPGSQLVKQVMGILLLGVGAFFIGISASNIA